MSDAEYDAWWRGLVCKREAYKKELYDWASSLKTPLTFSAAFTTVQQKAKAVNKTVLPCVLGRELELVEHGLRHIISFIIPMSPDVAAKEILVVEEAYGKSPMDLDNLINQVRQLGLFAPDGRQTIKYDELAAALHKTEASKTLGFLLDILRHDLHVTHFVADSKQYAREIATVFLCDMAHAPGVGRLTLHNGTISEIAGFSADLLQSLSKICIDTQTCL